MCLIEPILLLNVMSPDQIKYFLITRDPDRAEATVVEFGNDHEAALRAYSEAERENGLEPRVNTVLIGSDSLATIKKTHSSYFGDTFDGIKELLKL
jgi:hypothetical protein